MEWQVTKNSKCLMFSTFTTEWNIYSRHFTHKRSECSRHILSPQDWHCSVDLGQLSFSCFVLKFACWITHFFLFAVHSNLFFDFWFSFWCYKSSAKQQFFFQLNHLRFRPNPFISRRMTCDIVSVLARSQPKL